MAAFSLRACNLSNRKLPDCKLRHFIIKSEIKKLEIVHTENVAFFQQAKVVGLISDVSPYHYPSTIGFYKGFIGVL